MNSTIEVQDVEWSPNQEGSSEPDRLRAVIHLVLAIYLLPAFIVVMTVGAGLLVITGVVRGVCVASRALGFSRRRVVEADWCKRVKAPITDSFEKTRPIRQALVHHQNRTTQD